MITKEITLNRIEDVKNFVNVALTCDYDIELVSGRYTVDAKSIMGIFSLDLTKPIVMNAHCDNDEEFLKKITPHLYNKESRL